MKKAIIRICVLSLCLLPGLLQAQTKELKSRIEEFVRDKKAQIGVAVIIDGEETVTVNDTCRYPLMSLFKFHQALAVADYLQRNRLPLDAPILITKEELKTDTYSPLRDKYPEGNISLSIKELLIYTLQQSDNNACDILFAHTVGVEETDRYIRSLGIRNFSIVANEDDMHSKPDMAYENWSYPSETARLFEMLLTQELFGKPYQDFIKQTLIACETGKDRLVKPLLNTKALVGHKTGTSDRNAQGLLVGTNDAGFVLLPDGRHYTIVVLVKDSAEGLPDTSKMIAEISEIVYHDLCD